MPSKNVSSVMIAAFPYVFTSLMGVLIWRASRLENKVEKLLEEVPAMRVEIDYLKEMIMARQAVYTDPIPKEFKNEDLITLESLIHQTPN